MIPDDELQAMRKRYSMPAPAWNELWFIRDGRQMLDEIDRLNAELAEVQRLRAVDDAFHRLTIQQRDTAWAELAATEIRWTDALRQLKPRHPINIDRPQVSVADYCDGFDAGVQAAIEALKGQWSDKPIRLPREERGE